MREERVARGSHRPHERRVPPEGRPARRYSPAASYARGMRAGVLVGLALGLAVMGLVMWLWAVPTVDGALSAAAEAMGAVS